MTKPQAVLRRKDTTSRSALYIAFDLGDKNWQVSLGDDRFQVSRYTVAAGDTAAVAARILKAAERLRISGRSEVYGVYEAGRDGWWFHRWLRELGVDNIVVDAASIEVNRRARRAKTDRLDADKLLALLIRHHAGERVWSVLREPSVEDEDARREHRELQRLTHERIAHTNRIGSLLVMHNLRPGIVIGGRDWSKWWDAHQEQVPPLLRSEIERENARLKLVKDQVRAIESAHRKELAERKHPMVNELARLRAIGDKGSWVLVKEIFGWRNFSNRRELTGCVGLAPTPHASGSIDHEQGISKTGNRRARSVLIEQAWSWVRLQPGSELTQWFNRRFGGSGKRMRRVGIVALARRLAIALWRYLKDGVIPAGAVLKPDTGRA